MVSRLKRPSSRVYESPPKRERAGFVFSFFNGEGGGYVLIENMIAKFLSRLAIDDLAHGMSFFF